MKIRDLRALGFRCVSATSVWCGQYGVEEELFVGVPVIIGEAGAEMVLDVDLSQTEQKALNHSIEAVKDLNAAVDKLGLLTSA